MTMMLRALLPLLLLWTAALQAAPAFPTLSGRVVDEAALMSRKQAHQLTQQLAAFEKRSGIQLVVVSVDSLDGETIEEYGYQLGRHWGIGQKGKNNGVLLLIAQDERKVRIEVGYGLEGALPDAIAATTQVVQHYHRNHHQNKQPGAAIAVTLRLLDRLILSGECLHDALAAGHHAGHHVAALEGG